jgi:hypothetical protein
MEIEFEDIDSLLPETINNMINECLEDFDDINEMDETTKYAAKIAMSSITDKTRQGHVRFVVSIYSGNSFLNPRWDLRIIKNYILYHLARNKNWDAKAVIAQTPYDIISFITQKCGPVKDGFEGKKVNLLTVWT